MKNDSKVYYFFGFLTLVVEIVVFAEMIDHILDSPYWSLGVGITWLLFIATAGLFLKGAYESKTK